MTDNAPIEAVMVSFSKVKDGVKLVLVLHPNDVPDWLQLAPLGQRMAAALVPIADETSEHGQGVVSQPSNTKRVVSHEAGNLGHKPKRHWDDLSPAEQAGIRATDGTFQRWSFGQGRRATGPLENITDSTTQWIRDQCGVISRSDIKPGTPAAEKWREIDARFIEDTRLPEQRTG